MKNTAILLVQCPDRKGLDAAPRSSLAWPCASSCGLRRATLLAKPTGRKKQGSVGRPSWGSSFLGHPGAKFFDEKPDQKKRRLKPKKRDILIEVKKGTF